jgi:hypothetical protein
MLYALGARAVNLIPPWEVCSNLLNIGRVFELSDFGHYTKCRHLKFRYIPYSTEFLMHVIVMDFTDEIQIVKFMLHKRITNRYTVSGGSNSILVFIATILALCMA